MLLNRRVLTAIAVFCSCWALYGGGAFWLGIKAEETLRKQHALLAQLPIFKVKSYQYHRGWFTSTEVTELVFNRHLSGPYESLLPERIAPLLNTTIKFTSHIQHGPFPRLRQWDFSPRRASVYTEFAMSDQTRKTLSTFFGNQPPITIVNHLYVKGGGKLQVNIPAFDYQEALSGIKVNWQGFDMTLDYNKDYQAYKTEIKLPGIYLEASTKGILGFDNIHYLLDRRSGITGVKLGNSELTIAGIQLHSQENVPYNIKLNELLYLLTWTRVGEFINPTGAFKPSSVSLKGLTYQIVTSESNEFVNTRGKLNFAQFVLNDWIYGPMYLDVSASHLHGPTLVGLDKAIAQIPYEGVDPSLLRKEYINTIKKYGVSLLENNPKLIVNNFYLKMPSGEATLQGELGLNGFKKDDLEQASVFLKRFKVKATVSVPRQTLENLVAAQARNLFQVDQTAEDQPNMLEVENLARNLLDAQLSRWEEARYITENNAQIKTEVEYHDGILTVNKQKVGLPWEKEGDHVEE